MELNDELSKTTKPPPRQDRPKQNESEKWRAKAFQNLNQPGKTESSKKFGPRPFKSGKFAQNDVGRKQGNFPCKSEQKSKRRGGGDDFSKTLKILSDSAENYEVVKKLAEKNDQFNTFLRGKLDVEKFLLLVRVLRKVCESDFDKHKVMIINQSCHPDLMNLFPTMLMSACSEDRAKFGQLARDVVHFFSTLVRMLPITAASLKSAVKCCHLSILQVSLENPDYVSPDLLEKYETVKRDVEALQTEIAAAKPSWLSRRREEVERMKYEQPPNDFREISIYPTFEDLVNPKPPFLRPNVINGPYFDVEHYLDTQFRLLKEDFVRSLRQGVQDIVHGTNSRKKESTSVKTYQNVKFLEYVKEVHEKTAKVLNEGTLLCFDTSNGHRFRNANWETSKRFMHGALLCFTKNTFKTVLFATVSSRDLKFLRKRQILVNFHEKPGEDIFDPKATYIMIESEVFFEPYFQVLRALQNMCEDKFPFARYIIDVQKEDLPPSYLLPSGNNSDGVGTDQRVTTPRAPPKEKAVEIKIKGMTQTYTLEVLDESTWPPASSVGLDNSQYLALKAALTRELAVIQGPPGTGKTFMALKIAEILIRNKKAMGRQTPILVVCLTNHALDQFLVGMLPFTENLVRVGGQSKCEKLDQYNMRNMRRERSLKFKGDQRKLTELYSEFKLTERAIDCLGSALTLKQGICISKYGKAVPSILEDSVGELLPHESHVPLDKEGELTYVTFEEMEKQICGWKSATMEEIAYELKLYEEENESSEEENLAWMKSQEEMVNEDFNYYISVIYNLRVEVSAISEEDLQIGEKLARKWENRKKLDFSGLLCAYFYTIKKTLSDLREKRKSLLDNLNDQRKIVDELRHMENLDALKKVDVIGLTTNGAARMHSSLNMLGCEVVIVEEAAEVMESHIVASVSSKCKHLILIGDHKQLRPKISEYELGKFYNFDVSLFERMVINRAGCITLQVQHRQAPEMAKLIVPTIYKTLENHESVLDRPNLRSLTKRLSFITHSEPEAQDKENASRTNPFEARFLIALCQHLLRQRYLPDQITLLTLYKGQMFLIKQLIKSMQSNQINDLLKTVRVTVVDDFQGEESDIILLSLVRSNSEGRIGFLAIENRVCVALSRAKQSMVMIGDMDLLSANNPTWKAVRKSIEEQDAVAPFLAFRCEVHPSFTFKAEKPDDFIKFAPHGGCKEICIDQLACGHICNRVCHLVETPHEKIKCQEPCTRLCVAGLHPCNRKCYIQCGSNCNEKVTKDLPCGHQATMSCCIDAEKYFCQQIVTKKFTCEHEAEVACSCTECPQPCQLQAPCGHSCTRKCHTESDPDHLEYKCRKNCTNLNKNCRMDHACQKKCSEQCDLCDIEVQVKRSCGHNYKLKCHIDPEDVECTKTCNKMLECGHKCLRRCNLSCTPCIQIVKKEIDECGHFAQVPCGIIAEREDCRQKCEKLLPCGHKCKAKCAEECTAKCKEVVEVQTGDCGHEIKKLCFEKTGGIKADVRRCTAKCGEVLGCGHVCSGTCKGCHQGKFHESCRKPCNRQLICGHSCVKECSAPCQSCNKQNTVECEHGTNKMDCDRKRSVCQKKAHFKCDHTKRNLKCGTYFQNDPLPCKERCARKLLCQHQCVGFCGALCPKLCWECDKEELLKSFPINATVPEDPRFVFLPDCHHSIEVTGLLGWLKWQSANVEVKRCPLCEEPISARLSTFKLLIWEPYDDFNKIKEIGQTNGKQLGPELHRQIQILLRHNRVEVESLEEFATDLEATIEMELNWQLDSGRGRKTRYSRGLRFKFTTELPSYKIKIVVLRSLFQMLSGKGKRQLDDVKDKVDFIVERLRNCKMISLQQMRDFENLLSQLDVALQKQTGQPLSESKVRLPEPKSLLKLRWRKCLNCGRLEFKQREISDKCKHCSEPFDVKPVTFEMQKTKKPTN